MKPSLATCILYEPETNIITKMFNSLAEISTTYRIDGLTELQNVSYVSNIYNRHFS